MKIEVNDNVLKSNIGHNKVVYDIDYLLKNLARDVWLLEGYRQQKYQLEILGADEEVQYD